MAQVNRKHIVDFLALLDNLRVAHWQADTVTNTHKALGDLYEALAGQLDDAAELLVGKDGDREFPAASLSLQPGTAYLSLIRAGLDILTAMRQEATVGVDDDLLNILADMSAALNKAKYLLRL